MFTMTGRHTNRSFRNRAAALRWMERERRFAPGPEQKVEHFEMPTDGRTEGFFFYSSWGYDHDMTHEQYKELAKVQQRYQRLIRSLRGGKQ